MFPNNLFNRLSDKRTRDVNACTTGYNFALELFDKYVRLHSASNVHYRPDTIYAGLMSLSVNGGYAQSTMEDLHIRYGLDSPCGGAFLYRLRKLSYDDWNSRLTEVNDAVLSMASKLGLLDSLGKEGVLPFSIHESDPKSDATFTMVVCWSKKSEKLIPFATNVKGNARRLVRTIPNEYRRRWGIETSFRKVKEVHGRTLSPSPAIRLAYFMISMILYNLWQAINLMLRSEHLSTGDEENEYRVTMPFMVTIFYAHLNGRI